jgi:tetratricopeptide (TPR) repeat protein
VAAESNSLLNPLEASHLLGITPELLFAYVRNAPKGADGRRLIATQNGGQTYFLRSELLSFDAFLSEPWSESGSDRANVPAYILSHIKVECGGQCPRCGRGFKLETAHIVDYAISRSHHHHNLIRLCSLCHEEFDSKTILPEGDIESLKARLIARTRERLASRMAGPGTDGFRPPTPTDIFVGRQREMQQVADGLARRRIVCIQGPGGIGKTQLALHVLRQIGAEARVLWIDLEPLGAICDLHLVLASAISSAGDGYDIATISACLESQFDIVAFDGIEVLRPTDIEHFEHLLSQLAAGTSTARFLITSQVELLNVDGLLSIDILPLRTDASIQMLEVIAGNAANRDSANSRSALDWLTHFAEGHPLSLRIIANLLRYFKSATTVADRVKSMGAAAIASPTRGRKTKHRSLDTCFSMAYSVLRSDERRLLFLLSHCPAGRFSTHINNDLFAISDIELAIAELARWHLIAIDSSWYPVPRVHVLSPVRAFAKLAFQAEDAKLAEDLFHDLATEMEVQAAVLDDRYTSEGDPGLGTLRIGHEFPNFSYVFDESVRRSFSNPEYDRITCSLAFSLQVFCFVSGRSGRGLQMLDAGVKAALKMEQPGVASSLLIQAANFAQRMGAGAKARESLRQICSLRSVHPDLELAGNVAFAQGMLARGGGRLKEAEDHFVDASQHYAQPAPASGRDEKQVNRRMLALALMERARICEHSGRELEALEVYTASMSLMRMINDRVNIGAVLHQMGNCYAHLHQFDEAYRSYVDGAHCFFDLGSAIHLSNSLSELGYVLIDHDPGPSLYCDLSEEVVQAGLTDVFRECAARYRSSSARLQSQECIGVIRKLFGMVALVSFTSHAALLEDFAEVLQEELVRPLVGQLHDMRRDPGERLAIMHLDVMTALAGSLSVVETQSKATIEEIGHFAGLCYIQFDFAWRAFRLFDWLSEYLQRRRAWHGLDATQLKEAAAVSADTGQPFCLRQ